MYVCIYVNIKVCMYVCMLVFYVYIYVCLYEVICICVCMLESLAKLFLQDWVELKSSINFGSSFLEILCKAKIFHDKTDSG